jgi:hypothetical protein
MSDIRQARKALVARVLEGEGTAPHAERRAAFDNAALSAPLSSLVDKVANNAGAISDVDVAAVLAAGLSEDHVFEIAVCAAIGEATRQYESALAALGAVVKET